LSLRFSATTSPTNDPGRSWNDIQIASEEDDDEHSGDDDERGPSSGVENPWLDGPG